MKICPLTYEPFSSDELYSTEGLKKLQLQALQPFPYSAEEQRQEARLRADKISIQGIQAKLSVKLNVKQEVFEIVDQGGTYMVKPQSDTYPGVPQNEDLTMRLAASVGIEVPWHGLIYSKDGSFSYVIRRFDRQGRKEKIAMEDFAQLAGLTRETKYNFTMEKIIPILEKHCTFPLLEKKKLFLRTVFNFITGNEDMHLKNFSLITRDGKVELAPAYDFLNSTIALRNAREELALSLRGKKSNLKRKDFIDYYGQERMGLNVQTIDDCLGSIVKAQEEWKIKLEHNFLSEELKEKYIRLVTERLGRLDLV